METQTTPEAISETKPSQARKQFDLETVVALAGSALAAIWLFLTSIYAGPLWRDEVNTINVAQMPTLQELWNNLPFESFPPLWPLLLRGWTFLGMANSDAGIRLFSFFVGLSFLGSLWLCLRWIGGRAPTITLALLGSLPAFVFTMSSNRAYGLAICLLVLTFGSIWRVVESPSKCRIIVAGLVSLLFLHCVYYDVIFFCAMLFAAAMVAARRREWKTLKALIGIGSLTGPTLLIYAPIIHRVASYSPISQVEFGLPMLWTKLRHSLEARSSAQAVGAGGPEVWLWILLLAVAASVALVMQVRRSTKSDPEPSCGQGTAAKNRADLALFSILTFICGTMGYIAFLLRLQLPTQSWYYIGVFTLAALSLEGVLSVSWPSLRPCGLLRIGLLVILTLWNIKSVWEETHSRRTNVDLLAAVLNEKAQDGDLIVVQSAWEGITFDRYYRGRARWTTIPPMNSHKVHRTDLMLQELDKPQPMAPVLAEATDALRKGKRVWVVGHVAVLSPEQLPPAPAPIHLRTDWHLRDYWGIWGAQLTAHLLGNATQPHTLTSALDVPVNSYEDLPLLEFSGYRSPIQQQTESQHAVTQEVSVSH